jgi:membrane protease YdiL (CAAX protease family)
LIAVGLLLAVVNAASEELLWRVVLVAEDRSPVLFTLCVQALSFGVAHWDGIPFGWVGVVFTGIFSAVLYWSRRWGLAFALIAHFLADAVIVISVLRFAVYPPT